MQGPLAAKESPRLLRSPWLPIEDCVVGADLDQDKVKECVGEPLGEPTSLT